MGEVYDIAKRHGRFGRRVDGRDSWVEGDPVFSHSIINLCIDALGGWQAFVANERSDTSTVRAQFRDIYNSLRRERRRIGQAYLNTPRATWPDAVKESVQARVALPPAQQETPQEEGPMMGPPQTIVDMITKLAERKSVSGSGVK